GARLARRWRNELLFKWYLTPARYLPAVLGAQVLVMGRQAARRGCGGAFCHGLAGGVRGILAGVADRHPVGMGVYRLWRRLRRSRGLPLEAIEGVLPRARFASPGGPIFSPVDDLGVAL